MQYEFKLAMILAPACILLFFAFRAKKRYSLPLLLVISNLIIAIFLFGFGRFVYENYEHPPEWDFLVFWLDGNVAVDGANFYSAENYQKIEIPYTPSDEFRNEIIDIGFKYPPFTMFLLWPLGLMNISNAYFLWQIFNLIFCFACIYELWILFLHEHGLPGLVFVAALLFLLRSTFSSFYYAQTNFIVMMFFLLFWRQRSRKWGGFWLALCVLVKPYMAFLYLFPMFTRRWRTLSIAIFSLLTLTFLSIVIFGWDVFASFLNNPVAKVPFYLYTEIVNQSLLATLTRLTQGWIVSTSPLFNPLYIAFSLIILIITIWVCIKKNNEEDLKLMLTLLLGLIIYPATLEHYSIFLIIPVLMLLKQSGRSIIELIVIFLMACMLYAMVGFRQGSYTFFALALTWGGYVWVIANTNVRKLIPWITPL